MKTASDSPQRVIDTFRAGTSFLVTSHVSPDGDAVGSLLGVAHLLAQMGKSNVSCVLEDPIPRVYTWLSKAETILPPDKVGVDRVDVAVLIDAHAAERAGKAAPLLQRGKTFVVIDHHLVDKADGDLQFIDPTYAAAGEMVYELYQQAGLTPSRAAAECMYTAQTTDTGSFRYSNTNERSHRVAAGLIATGINVRDITSRVIDTMSRGKYFLLKRVLDRIQFLDSGSVALADIYVNDLQETGALNEDTDGLINYLRNIEGVRLAMLFRETEDGKTKVSFRTQPDINAAEICRAFGGGGHAAAAGATLPWPITLAKEQVLNYLRTSVGLHV